MAKALSFVPYGRVSRVAGRDTETETSAPDQRRAIELTADARGLILLDWLEDFDQSGGKWERPGFQEALRRVEAGEADGIIVASMDRFSRSVLDGLRGLARIEAAGGQFVSVKENFDTTTPMGRAMMQISLVFAELYRAQNAEVWDVQRRDAIGRGIHITAHVPAGYRRGADKRLELDPEAAPAIHEVFIRRAAGESWDQLCAFLDERLPRENGGHWSRGTVSGIICNRAYLGEARAGDITNKNAHDAIVTRAEWEAAQAKVGRAPRQDAVTLLPRLIRCASCGHTMTRRSDGRRGYANYACRRRHGDAICPEPVRISVTRADAFVEAAFLEWVRKQDIAATATPRTEDLASAVSALESAETELAEYRDAHLISLIGREAFVAGLTERQRTVDAARVSVAAAQKVSPLPMTFRLVDDWPKIPLALKRKMLADPIESVICRRAPIRGKGTRVEDRLEIRWRADAREET